MIAFASVQTVFDAAFSFQVFRRFKRGFCLCATDNFLFVHRSMQFCCQYLATLRPRVICFIHNIPIDNKRIRRPNVYFKVKMDPDKENIKLSNLLRFLSQPQQIETNAASYFHIFFYLPLGCLSVNFGPLLRRQPHSPDLNHCVLSIFETT